jgi:hypothetical protein
VRSRSVGPDCFTKPNRYEPFWTIQCPFNPTA